jgi:hypothetical protein
MSLVIPMCLQVPRSIPKEKTTFDERCAIFALYHTHRPGAKPLAIVFSLHRVVIHQIAAINGPLYRNVKAVYHDIGLSKMYEKYVRQDYLDRLAACFVDPEQNQTDFDTEHRNQIGHGPSNRAAKRRGEHLIKEHRFTIQWLEAGQHSPDAKEGWYFMVPDKFPDQWLGGDKGAPFTTSTECYAFCKDLAEYW